MEIKDRINDIILQYALTPSRFADEIGVQRSNISHILSGRNKPSLDFILKVLEKFPDIDSDWLIKGTTGSNSSYSTPTDVESPTASFKRESESINNETASLFNSPKIENLPPPAQAMVKNEQENALNQANNSPNAQDSSLISPKNKKRIKRILVFYDDNSFEEFTSN